MPYTYQKLSTPTTIRLIQVMPDKVNDAIACTIHTYETQKSQENPQKVSYRALSYRWGDPQVVRHVFLKDVGMDEWNQHEVHENLWQFIDHAWHQNLFEDLFWTDYFCLDQSSEAEIAQQIPRMGVIYSEATETVIWLGLSEKEDTQIRYYIEDLDKIWWTAKEVEQIDNDADKEALETAAALWQNEYWSRLWIVQEVVLARRARVMMRFLSIDLKDLWDKTTGASTVLRTGKSLPSMTELRALRQEGPKELWYLLRDYISLPYRCAKPNDRLHGMLGLLPTSTDVFPINYERPYGHVILDAILEAGANWPPSWVEIILNGLDKDNDFVLTKNPNTIEEYLYDGRALARHKRLATFALEAFDAMCFIMTFIDADAVRDDWSHRDETASDRRAMYMEQEAVFLGITLDTVMAIPVAMRDPL